jgi:hypothetical protein
MHLVFGIDFDHGSCPGPLGEQDAVVGEAWVGPRGLLALLETALGTGGPVRSQLERVAALVPAVLATEGFWTESAELDPLATARTLLRWRDRLWMHGWRGEGLTERLKQLSGVTELAHVGTPDRLLALLSALESRSADLAVLELCESRDRYPPLWREVFSALERRGCRVQSREVRPASATGDLLAAREGKGKFSRDGSLQLLRRQGPLEAAEETAAWLAALPDLDRTVVLGADETLDAALVRFGLPTLGGSSAEERGSLLAILPLVLQLGWEPPDPQAALDLLNLPITPVPGRIAWRLRNALDALPAVGSEKWSQGLSEGLAELEGDDYRNDVAARLTALLEPRVSRSVPYPVEEIRRRVDAVSSWLAARAAVASSVEGHLDGSWRPVLDQGRLLLSVIDATGRESLEAPELARVVAEATATVQEGPRREAQAGLTAVDRPGGVVGPARRIVWWGFENESAPHVSRWPLSAQARRALEDHGVELPDLGLEAQLYAELWRRPLLAAEQALFLVTPRRGSDGRETYPHPLWDELVGANGFKEIRPLEVTRPIIPAEPRRRALRALEPPTPRRGWNASPELLPRRATESPSSLGRLLGCSLQWALGYHAKLRPGRPYSLPDPSRSRGNLLHAIVERVLLEESGSPEQAEAHAEELFETLGPLLDARLFLPGSEEERAELRLVAGKSARRLREILESAGRKVLATEEWREGPAFAGTVGGYLDLLLGEPPAVIDLKLGGGNRRRGAFERGAVHDLAIYGHLLRQGEEGFPPVGYFILTEQALLTNEAGGFGTGETIAGPSLEEVWAGLGTAVGDRLSELANGKLEAAANPGEEGEEPPRESALVDGRLVCEPGCRFCDFAALCGLRFSEAADA